MRFLLLSFVFIFSACCSTFTKEELYEYIKDPENGFVNEKQLAGTDLKLTYKPYQLFAQQELRSVDSLTPEKKAEIENRYSKNHYFILSISQGGREILSNAADRQRFSMLVQQFAFGMGEKVTLTTAEQDTLQLLDYHYPRMYGMAASTDMVFVFEKEKKKTDYYTFHLNEFGLKNGNTWFKVDSKIPLRSKRIKIKEE